MKCLGEDEISFHLVTGCKPPETEAGLVSSIMTPVWWAQGPTPGLTSQTPVESIRNNCAHPSARPLSALGHQHPIENASLCHKHNTKGPLYPCFTCTVQRCHVYEQLGTQRRWEPGPLIWGPHLRW